MAKELTVHRRSLQRLYQEANDQHEQNLSVMDKWGDLIIYDKQGNELTGNERRVQIGLLYDYGHLLDACYPGDVSQIGWGGY